MPPEVSQDNSASSTDKVDVPIEESMKAFLEERSGEKVRGSESEGDANGDSKGKGSSTDDPGADGKKPEGEEKDKKEEGQKDDKTAEEKKKENRYQRLKRQTEDLRTELAKKDETVDRAVYQANIWRQRYMALEAEFGKVVQSKSVELSDAELENITHRVRDVDNKLAPALSEQAKKRQAEIETREYVAKKTEEYTEAALDLSSKYEVDAADLLETFATMQSRGYDMERVAKILRADGITSGKIKPKSASVPKPKAPVPLRTSGTGTVVDFAPTVDGMKEYLDMKRNLKPKKR